MIEPQILWINNCRVLDDFVFLQKLFFLLAESPFQWITLILLMSCFRFCWRKFVLVLTFIPLHCSYFFLVLSVSSQWKVGIFTKFTLGESDLYLCLSRQTADKTSTYCFILMTGAYLGIWTADILLSNLKKSFTQILYSLFCGNLFLGFYPKFPAAVAGINIDLFLFPVSSLCWDFEKFPSGGSW